MASRNKKAIHPDPVWGDRADSTVHARLDELESYEILPSRRLDGGSYEICAIPFFAYDVNLGDRVATELEDVDGTGQTVPRLTGVVQAPAGWRFLIAPGHEDVWYDEALLRV